MTEIVSGVLKLTFGFLANKTRSKISERLNNGDVTDEECRRLIVRELDDIKRKLDGLARKDLVSSLFFLQEGINGLYQSLQQFNASENEPESTEHAISACATSSEETSPVSQINEVVSLINAFNSLKIHSKERYSAREKATEAFSIETLSIEDRIQASQVRMMARILEKSEDPDAGVSDCLQYLKQLHDIKAIQEIFSVLIEGGIKSRLNKTKRLSHVSSVYQMNVLLFEFARKFTNLRTVFFEWPGILLGNETHNPLVKNDRLIKKHEVPGVEITSSYRDFTFPQSIEQSYCIVNSKQEIVAEMRVGDGSVQILKPSGESRTIFDPSKQEDASYCEVAGMDIDGEDNLYVVTAFRKRGDRLWGFKLLKFDEHGNKKLESLLPFQHDSVYYVFITANDDKWIAVLDREKKLYVGTSCKTDSFEIDYSFHLEEIVRNVSAVRFLDNKGTKIIVAGYEDCFYIYTENGELERKVMIPEEYGHVQSVAIDYIAKRILVKTGGKSVHLCNFSETGELNGNTYLGSGGKLYKKLHGSWLISNPHGAVALVGEKQVFFLQL